ncbi:hypothetical protein [Bradyrhizobium sp. WD16]|uniref:hypothetical protein n=1 Tax=Bradyrhizobium sp. WD16 TaxID=1521768 RepID=UPI0020A61660|nr:hypothetical protein [Bradyrhizobium sp. WD16]
MMDMRDVLGVAVLAIGLAASVVVPVAAADDGPQETLAAQVRIQGLACGKPQKAERDAALSKPDEAVWILTCDNATYRLRLIPHMAARIEQIRQ